MNLFILVTGSRDEYSENRIRAGLESAYSYLKQECGNISKEEIFLVHGDARGADKTAAGIAASWGWTPISFPADWDKHKRAAGAIRNGEMVNYLIEMKKLPETYVVCVAFPLQKSIGTLDCMRRAEIAGFEVIKEPAEFVPD